MVISERLPTRLFLWMRALPSTTYKQGRSIEARTFEAERYPRILYGGCLSSREARVLFAFWVGFASHSQGNGAKTSTYQSLQSDNNNNMNIQKTDAVQLTFTDEI